MLLRQELKGLPRMQSILSAEAVGDAGSMAAAGLWDRHRAGKMHGEVEVKPEEELLDVGGSST